MKLKNLKLKKAIFTIGMSCLITGCKEYELKEINVETQEIVQDKLAYIDNDIIVISEEIVEYKENIYTTANLNLRKDANTDCEIITVIDKCQKVARIEDLGEWSYVKYNDLYGYVNNSYINKLPDNYIEVDISEQNIKYHIGEEIILDSDVVTGKQNSMDTRIGMFEIYGKQTARFLMGRWYVDYWMPFDGGIGLHDASWRDEFGGEIYINSGSHGCVNLPFDTAKEIYDNSEVGTKVLVHK